MTLQMIRVALTLKGKPLKYGRQRRHNGPQGWAFLFCWGTNLRRRECINGSNELALWDCYAICLPICSVPAWKMYIKWQIKGHTVCLYKECCVMLGGRVHVSRTKTKDVHTVAPCHRWPGTGALIHIQRFLFNCKLYLLIRGQHICCPYIRREKSTSLVLLELWNGTLTAAIDWRPCSCKLQCNALA